MIKIFITVYLAFALIVYELIKLIFLKKYWLMFKNIKDYPIIYVFDLIYLGYIIFLLFTPVWLNSLAIFALSFVLQENLKNNNEYTNKLKSYLIIDCIASIILLLLIIKQIYNGF
jgi:hypothetical protein